MEGREGEGFGIHIDIWSLYVCFLIIHQPSEFHVGSSISSRKPAGAGKDYAGTFVNCTSLQHIVFGEKVTEVAGNAFSYTAARPNTVTRSGTTAYYFLNPKTKINMGTSTDTQERSGLLTNTPVTCNAKSTSFSGTINSIDSGSQSNSSNDGNTIITGNVNSKQATVKWDYKNIYSTDKTFTITYQPNDSTDAAFSASNDKETMTENITSILGNSVGVAKSGTLNSLDASISAGKAVFSGKTKEYSVGYGASQSQPYPSGFYVYTLYHTINMKNNATKVTLTKTAASKTIPAFADVALREVKDDYYAVSNGSGGYELGNSKGTLSDSTRTLASDLSLSPNITITGNFSSATFKTGGKSYAKNSSGGTADMTIYTRTGSYADKNEVQTAGYAYPETLDVNTDTLDAATNGGSTQVTVRDIDSASVPYVADEECRKNANYSFVILWIPVMESRRLSTGYGRNNPSLYIVYVSVKNLSY